MEALYQKPSIGKRILLLVLVLATIIVSLWMTITILWLIQGFNLQVSYMVSDKNLYAFKFVNDATAKWMTEPTFTASHWTVKDIDKNVFDFQKQYPSIIEIYTISNKGKISNPFSRVESVKIHDGILKNITIFQDSAKLVNTADIELYRRYDPIIYKTYSAEIEGNRYRHVYLDMDNSTLVLIQDHSVMGSMLKEVFDKEKNENNALYESCFREIPGVITAHAVFYNPEGNEIYSLGSGEGFFTLKSKDYDYSAQGFKFKIDINTRNQAFPFFYNSGKKLYYIHWALFILTAVFVLIIVVTAPKLSGYSKK